jgi:outer membrane protein TolC
VLSLREALDAAVGNNPIVQLYKERIEAARAQTMTQLGTMLPNFSGQAQEYKQTNYLGQFGLAPVRSAPFTIAEARVTASQSLFSLSLLQKWRASRESLHVSEFEAEANKYETMGTVALVYMDALKAEALVQARETNQTIMSELLGILKQRQRSGAATGLDAARLEAQLANERQLLATARYDRVHAVLNLVTQLALPIETQVSLRDAFQPAIAEAVTAEWAVEEAIRKRPEVQAQVKRMRAAELTYSSITGERIPSLVGQGNYGRIGNRYDNTVDTYNMTLMLQIPLFDGGQREGRISEARSQLKQEAWRMQAVINQVKFEVHDALAAMTAAQEAVTIATAGLQSALRELTLARERFATISGANQFEVTNALNNVTRARENHVTALYQFNAARVNLARATGTLSSLN